MEDLRFPGHDPRYRLLSDEALPQTECLKDTVERFLPFWEESIVPNIRAQKKILIVAHGNSLRALIKHLDRIADDEIAHVNIPTGKPLVYELDEALHPIKSGYLGNPEAVKQAMAEVERQGKAQNRPTQGSS